MIQTVSVFVLIFSFLVHYVQHHLCGTYIISVYLLLCVHMYV